ncbi:lysophospholipid acyltransferase family protein [Beggiatoa leptomitoformis]|uniref:1-acyl-sn-glycerol-3-phosphate acyltransferase n=1 Tax=Beggiatoa leptomitoformis TaxID=288004 RepID=A0A2N9YFQ7_9GAMM|nr:lysophospholipid acyltransferase family protein [Beggiatoa leptomitoformis]ALG68349.1 1-acyl-sn-glycerol-3-phosphate acyltransferase [Beggiatoa leptomitoformis]AUI69332.1 1-acyl-sn-glycerol-3-phosphate acyltransferase [Beggiatoa leptomitoformis]
MSQQPQSSTIRASIRIFLFIAWCILLASLQTLFLFFRFKNKLWLPMIFHRGCCRILGFHIQVTGELTEQKTVLFVSNHISYVDVIILGGVLSGSFVAKAEVAKWPLLGGLAKLQDTLFIERVSLQVKNHLSLMQNALNTQRNLILFPEGTSGNGNHVLPFKSALFRVVETESDNAPLVQPVTVAYTHCDNIVMTQALRDYYAWYDDTPLLTHFFRMAGMRSVSIQIMLHPAVKGSNFASRKALAEYCQLQVAQGLEKALSTHSVEGVKLQ